ncbi:MAG: bifunctional diguanylate cyclase/phosphodiesterase [Actinomycetota bacterium]|nr:bifunctional diguanylate cyclase/phosphodiesterase [Actinomycetota bacterium]
MSRRSRRRAAEAAIAQQAAALESQMNAQLSALRERADAEVARVRADYDAALAASGTVFFQEVAPGSDTFHVSTSAEQVLGWQPVMFLTPGMFRAMVHPDDLERFDHQLAHAGRGSNGPETRPAPSPIIDLTTGSPLTVSKAPLPSPGPPAQPLDGPVRFRSAGGTWRSVEVRADRCEFLAPGTPTLDEPATCSGALVDVTELEQRRTSTRRFAEVVEHDPSACLVAEFADLSDPASLMLRAANRSAHAMFNLEARQVDGTALESILGPASAQLIRSALFDVCHTGQTLTAERISLSEVPGTYLDLRVDRLSDGTLGVSVTDVTTTVALEDRLRHQASHDALTALPNRSLLEERLAVSVAAASPNAPLSLAVVDIDGLAGLNDTLGLHLADQLLVQIGRRLVREVRGAAVVSRIGGDEFAVLSMPCSSEAEALDRAHSVRVALDRPFDIAGHIVSCKVSIGVAITPGDGDDGRSLLRAATRAVETAKRDGSGFARHEDVDASSSIHRLSLLADLRRGLADQDLELRFQPMIDLRSGRVAKVEAMLRWRRDDGTQLPLEFLELAEQSGLIQPLTRWVLGEAARAATLLRDAGHDVVVSTDLSMRNLIDPDLAAFVSLLVTSGELHPDLIEIEVGEVELMDDPVRSRETLAALSELGLRFVVDDFGTGYTSLSTMQHLPVVGLKIDRTFISSLADASSDAAIVRSTIELCHELGLRVGADGVPDATTLSMLADFGCDHAQGVHLSEAVTIDALPGRVDELEHAVRSWVG